MQKTPYFLKNEKWYYYDEKTFMYKLTVEATEEAKESYVEFYNESDNIIIK